LSKPAPEAVSNLPGPSSPDPQTRNILARLKSVEGHVRGVARMVEEDAYCMDVVHQLRGIQRALAKVNGLILDRHLHSCATAALRGDDPEDRERVIQELLDAFAAAERG
jgi:DNA-binding FrmR family transcriptional regulator